MTAHTITEPCPTCKATGRFYAKRGKGLRTRTVEVTCPNCGGTGAITRPVETMTLEAFRAKMTDSMR